MENGFKNFTVRFALKNNNGKRFYGALCVFLTKNGTYLSVLTVQVSEEINTENVPTVSHALLHKKTENGTLFAAENHFFKR